MVLRSSRGRAGNATFGDTFAFWLQLIPASINPLTPVMLGSLNRFTRASFYGSSVALFFASRLSLALYPDWYSTDGRRRSKKRPLQFPSLVPASVSSGIREVENIQIRRLRKQPGKREGKCPRCQKIICARSHRSLLEKRKARSDRRRADIVSVASVMLCQPWRFN